MAEAADASDLDSTRVGKRFLLVLALMVPKELGVGLTVTGLAALAVFRVAAITGRWLPRRLSEYGETTS